MPPTSSKSPAAVEIIDASAVHAPVIADFNLAMALETEGLALDRSRLLDGVRAVFEHPARGFYLVAKRQDAVVGCLMITTEWSDWRNAMFWWIQSVYVDPAHRRMSVFTELYREVVRRAAQRGDICGIRLYVERDNTAAQAVYRSLGMDDSGYRVFAHALR